MMTTLLTLGMLVFSATQAISSWNCAGERYFTAFLKLRWRCQPERERNHDERFLSRRRAGWRRCCWQAAAIRPIPKKPPAGWLQLGTQGDAATVGHYPGHPFQQLLTGWLNGQTQSLLVLLNAGCGHKVTLAGLSSWGSACFATVRQHRDPYRAVGRYAPATPASRCWRDVMFSHWPLGAWQPQLPKGWTLKDTGTSTRTA